MERDPLWDGLKEHSKKAHKERVAKNGDRILYAKQQFEKNGIEFVLKNEQTGHFHIRSVKNDKLVQFWAGTGTIVIDGKARSWRGVHNAVKYAKTH